MPCRLSQCNCTNHQEVVEAVGGEVKGVGGAVKGVVGVIEAVVGEIETSSRTDALPKNLIALLVLLGCRVSGKNAASEACSSRLPMHSGSRNGDNKRAAQ
jgi:hypothetical protein